MDNYLTGEVAFKLNRSGIPYSCIAHMYGLNRCQVAGRIRRYKRKMRLLDEERPTKTYWWQDDCLEIPLPLIGVSSGR